MRFLWLGFILAAWLPAWSADGLVLTGLARSGGISHAYFYETAAGKYFTLTIDEDYAGLRLIEVNSRHGWALVAEAHATNRVEYVRAGTAFPAATNSGQLPSAGGSNTHLPRPRPRIALPDAPGLAETTPSATDQVPVPLGGTDGASQAAVLQADGIEVTARTAGPRQVPSADELYKTRNGYGAYEELRRQRQQAEVLAVRAAPPNDP